MVTFSSPKHEHCNDDGKQYHSYAEQNDETVVLYMRNRHFICEQSEEG